MLMKTKEDEKTLGLAQTLPLNVCHAPQAQARSGRAAGL